jgi:hypothetical protein
MTSHLAHTVLLALLSASVVLAVPAGAPTSPALPLFQDGGWDPGPPLQPPANFADGTGPELVDDCHFSGRITATLFSQVLSDIPGPFFNWQTIRLRNSNASIANQATSRGLWANATGLAGSASLYWQPLVPEPPPGCCHNVECSCNWYGRMTITRVVGAMGYPASGFHSFGSGTSPNTHTATFTANGCPPLGIPPVTVQNRLAYWLQVMWTKEDEDEPYDTIVDGGQDQDRVVGGGPLPPIGYNFIPGEQWSGDGDWDAVLTVTLGTIFTSRHIFCHNSQLQWINQLGLTRAHCTPNSTAGSRSELNPTSWTYLYDYVGGQARFPNLNAWDMAP